MYIGAYTSNAGWRIEHEKDHLAELGFDFARLGGFGLYQ
jgi:hypothetical protein